jgi:outer membrane protein OmpA-like peptidoglycan-associated protein
MRVSRGAACCLAAAGVAVFSTAALAKDSTLIVVIGGEAYDGPPKFEAQFDGQTLGQGTVAAAIDTAKTGRFADAVDKAPYVQKFTFTVPEKIFRPEGDVRIKFLNEAYGGPGSSRDRNLYIGSVTLNGKGVGASGLSTEAGFDIEPNEMLGAFLVIPDGSRDAVAAAPSGGWPRALGDVAAASQADRVAKGKAAPADPIKVAALDDGGAASTLNCDLDEIYNVVGFNENSNELTPTLIERLDQVATDIGDRQCNVQVTGYSSKRGTIASNALFAIERAQNALRYLQEHGVKFVRASATGVGATDQFGPDFRSNRRVVISVTP